MAIDVTVGIGTIGRMESKDARRSDLAKGIARRRIRPVGRRTSLATAGERPLLCLAREQKTASLYNGREGMQPPNEATF
jgi:hypothetical protein